MSIRQLWSDLKEANIRLWVEGEALKFRAPKGALNDQLRDQLKKYKPELIQYLQQSPTIELAPEQPHYPLSSAQERLWILFQIEGVLPVYNVPLYQWLEGDVHIEKLKEAFDFLQQRHEILRTHFIDIDGVPYQKIVDESWVQLNYIDIQEADKPDEVAQKLATEASEQLFDLYQGPLFDLVLVHVEAKRYLLLLTMHHVISDGVTIQRLQMELVQVYLDLINEKSISLSPLIIQYRDYSSWQQNWLVNESAQKDRTYWQQQVGSNIPILNMPTDFVRPAIQTFDGDEITQALSIQTTDKLHQLARKTGSTIFMVLLAGVKWLLHIYTRNEDIIIGSPVAGRFYPELQDQVGFYINMLPLRDTIDSQESFSQFLGRVRQTVADGMTHQMYPFEKIVTEVGVQRDFSRSPLFDVTLTLQNQVEAVTLDPGLGFTVRSFYQHTGTSKVDLTFNFHEMGDQLQLGLEYNIALFKGARIKRMVEHIQILFEKIAIDSQLSLSQLALLPDWERELVTRKFNETERPYPKEQTIVSLFETQVQKTPKRTALIFEEDHLEYEELNKRANQVAYYLQAKGVRKNSLVGVYMERSLNLVIALYGILKAGGAYLPIDPTYPAERIAFMLEDSAVDFLIVDIDEMNLPDGYEGSVLNLSNPDSLLKSQPTINLKDQVEHSNIAYMIYTSGSTGKPKGALNAHSGVVNRLFWMQELCQLGENDRVLQKTPFSFDVSVWEFFLPLLNGATLVIAKPEGHKDPEYLMKLIEEKSITVLHFVPSMLLLFIERLNKERCLSLKQIICSGEALPVAVQNAFFMRSEATLYNLYGPTEAAIDVTWWECVPNEERSSVPIGYPIANTQIYILDSEMNPVPIGVPGELYIGGIQVGQGYHQRPELTAERFLLNRFSGQGDRLYKTGDLACWTDGGFLEYLGRLDFQVKLRGFRIELGEIEAVLNDEGIVQQSVVLLYGEGEEKRLIAYLLLAAAAAADPEGFEAGLHARLFQHLPEYMIPSQFVVVDEMPLSPNGKVDRRALMSMTPTNIVDERIYEAPSSVTEKLIAQIWEDILGVTQIGRQDDFFALGGHSLKATRVILKIREALDIKLSLRTLFSESRLAAFARVVDETEKELYESIPKQPNAEDYPVSHGQRRLLVIDQMGIDMARVVYNISMAMSIDEKIELNLLEHVLNLLAHRHESLRTTFVVVGDEVRQQVHEKMPLKLNLIDLRNEENGEAKARELSVVEAERPFDLQKGPLWAVHLFQISDIKQILLFNIHHIVSDEWSVEQLTQEFSAAYEALKMGHEWTPKRLKIQYRDYAAWQKAQLSDGRIEDHRRYWHQLLAGELPLLQLVTDFPRPKRQSFAGAFYSFDFSLLAVQGMQKLSEDNGTTMFMNVVALVKLLLYRYSGQDDIIIGYPTSGREHPDLIDQIGFYVNMLPLRTSLAGNQTFDQLLLRVRDQVQAAFAHQIYPFDRLVEELNVPRNIGRAPLFDVVVNYIEENNDGSLTTLMSPFSFEPAISKFDLLFSFVGQGDDRLSLSVNYNTDLFSKERIVRMGEHIEILLSSIDANKKMPIAQLNLLPASERELVIKTFNQTARRYPKSASLAELFRLQVAKHPEKIAVIYEDVKLTYKELDRASDEVAIYLLEELKVQPEERVGILLNRSEQTVVGLLGILKAGSAYLPLDPQYPISRIAYMVKDASCRAILTEPEYMGGPLNGVNKVDIRQINVALDVQSSRMLNGVGATINGRSLAYVIYTSGSTGTPKGVLVEQKSVSRLVLNSNYIDLGAEDTLLQTGSLAFDASTFEIWGMLLNGGRICLAPQTLLLDGDEIGRLIKKYEVTTMWLTSTLFNQLMETKRAIFIGLKRVLVGGEALSAYHINLAREIYPELQLINGYGPTENTTFTTCYPIQKRFEQRIPIGYPIGNTEVFIMGKGHLESVGEPVPVGVVGEICIGGDGLARGYLNDPLLTKEKFITHPFDANKRIYRTGDNGYWRPDGAIEFLGRIDKQVKLRGFRIELGEIETVLIRYHSVKQAVVLPLGEGETKRLVAYLLFTEIGSSVDEIDLLRTYVQQQLPNYMVPSQFVLLSEMPLTTNGKMDQRALVALTPVPGAITEEGYEAPQTNREMLVAEIWQEILDIERIGRHDDFFDLGGHSLKATRVVLRVQQLMNMQMPLHILFEHSTVAEFSVQIDALQSDAYEMIPVITDAEHYSVSHAQRRLWVIEQMGIDISAYNIPLAVRMKSALNRPILEQALKLIGQRHESLRTYFNQAEGELKQLVVDEVKIRIEYVDMREEENREEKGRLLFRDVAQRPFDLSQAPLWSVHLIQLAESESLFLLNLHHIISDGWSVDILIREINEAYQQLLVGKSWEPERLPIQYRDYAAWQDKILNSDRILAHQTYWHQLLSGEMPVLQMPTDFERPSVQQFDGGYEQISLSPSWTKRLIELGKEEGATLFMMSTALLNLLLFRYTGQKDIIIGYPSSGRTHPDLAKQVGFYVNMLPLRSKIDGEESFSTLLQKVKESITNALEHQIYPFDRLVEELDIPRDMSRSPIFDVAVMYEEVSEDVQFEQMVEPFEFDPAVSKFDLLYTFTFQPDHRLSLTINYSKALFRGDRISRMCTHFQELVSSVLEQDAPIKQLNILPEIERNQVVCQFNQTKFDYPADRSLAELFQMQVVKTPEQIAVQFGDVSLTYRELDEQSTRFGAYLQKQFDIQREERIGFLFDRSEKTIVIILAILKVGGAYLPLDPIYPAERIHYMVKDCDTRIVISEPKYRERLPEKGIHYIDINQIDQLVGDDDQIDREVNGRSLAYVIYTSGSTGNPKGVLVEQRSVSRLVLNTNYIDLKSDDIILQTGSLAFDASTFEIWGMLLNGGRIVLAPQTTLLEGEELKRLIRKYQATIIWLTSSLLNQLVETDVAIFSGLRTLLSGGEALSSYHIKKIETSLPDIDLINGYGPTENTTFTTCYPIKAGYDQSIPIGYPIGNSTVYIIADGGQPAPIGFLGEIWSGGDGVARGYLNDPILTNKKFIDDPFAEKGRVYRTGDIGYWRFDGGVQFVGRVDHQVKIRGFRVEVEAVQLHLQSCDGVEQAVVIVQQTTIGTKELIGYFIGQTNEEQLRRELSGRVPQYMVPAHLVLLESFPLNQNGKVNRNALPKPMMAVVTKEQRPQTDLERLLTDIWSSVLRLQSIGTNSNYFALGGDSIKAIQIVNRLLQAGWRLKIQDLFEYPTITELALRVEKVEEHVHQQHSIVGAVPLSSAQQWFFDTFDSGPIHHFNQSVLLRAEGRIEEVTLQLSLDKLMEQHDILRAVYSKEEGKWKQTVLSSVRADLKIVDWRENENIEADWIEDTNQQQKRCDLSQAPLFRAILYQLPEEDRLLLIAHHLLVDGVSWRILLEDLNYSYPLALKNESIQLPAKTETIRSWVDAAMNHTQERYSKASVLLEWEKEMHAASLFQGIEQFNQTISNLYSEKEEIGISFSKIETMQLLSESNEAYTTEINDLLLLALARAWKKRFGTDQISVVMEGHGRTPFSEEVDLNRTVGWFTTLYPVSLKVVGEELGEQIKRLKEYLRRIPDQGSSFSFLRYWGEPKVVERLSELKGMISFNYLGQFDIEEGDNYFNFASEGTGEQIGNELKRPFLLDFTGLVSNNQMVFSLAFPKELCIKEEMSQLIADFKAELLLIVAHCRQKEEGEKTASDFSAVDLSEEEFDNILGQLL